MATADGSYTPRLVVCGHVTTVAARKSRTLRGILVVYFKLVPKMFCYLVEPK